MKGEQTGGWSGWKRPIHLSLIAKLAITVQGDWVRNKRSCSYEEDILGMRAAAAVQTFYWSVNQLSTGNDAAIPHQVLCGSEVTPTAMTPYDQNRQLCALPSRYIG
jgi:hypothetical protein